jgi:hypothetical protein
MKGKIAQTKKTFKFFGNPEGLNISVRVMRIEFASLYVRKEGTVL